MRMSRRRASPFMMSSACFKMARRSTPSSGTAFPILHALRFTNAWRTTKTIEAKLMCWSPAKWLRPTEHFLPSQFEEFDLRKVDCYREICLELVASREGFGALAHCRGDMKKIPCSRRDSRSVFGAEFVRVIQKVADLFAAKAQAS